MPDDSGNIRFLPPREGWPSRRLRLIDGPAPVAAPPSRFMPAEDLGAVYIGTVRFDREQTAVLAALFSREAARSGDWSLYDQLNAARDGLTPEPPPEAA